MATSLVADRAFLHISFGYGQRYSGVMRYGIKPTNPLEWFALKTGKAPLPIVDTILPLIQARALMAAATTGVMRSLAKSPRSVLALASELSLDADCLSLVLRVLESMSYTTRVGNEWSLSPMGQRHFGADAIESYQAFVEYGPAQWNFIANLDQVLRTGRGIDFHDNQTPGEWKLYQRSMLENAKASAWFIVKNTPVPAGANSCLDIAGSHGCVGGLLCQQHPTMRSTVLDRPEALATACELGRGEPWYPFVTFQEGDLLTADFGRDRDVVILSNILHHFGVKKNLEILKRVRESLKPNGVISIFEVETPEPDDRPEAGGDGFALYFRITSTSSCFRAKDYLDWLSETQFRNPRVIRSIKMPSRILVVAER